MIREAHDTRSAQAPEAPSCPSSATASAAAERMQVVIPESGVTGGSETQQAGGGAADDGVAAGGGQVDRLDPLDRVGDAHVEGVVGAEQGVAGAGDRDQAGEGVTSVDERVEVQGAEVLAGRAGHQAAL